MPLVLHNFIFQDELETKSREFDEQDKTRLIRIEQLEQQLERNNSPAPSVCEDDEGVDIWVNN